jgi:hypothetical protein
VGKAIIISHESANTILSKPADDGHAALCFIIADLTTLSVASNVWVVGD